MKICLGLIFASIFSLSAQAIQKNCSLRYAKKAEWFKADITLDRVKVTKSKSDAPLNATYRRQSANSMGRDGNLYLNYHLKDNGQTYKISVDESLVKTGTQGKLNVATRGATKTYFCEDPITRQAN